MLKKEGILKSGRHVPSRNYDPVQSPLSESRFTEIEVDEYLDTDVTVREKTFLETQNGTRLHLSATG